jgi:hypothetical protein
MAWRNFQPKVARAAVINLVILSDAKDLLFAAEKQVLRFAQDDKFRGYSF